MKFLLSIIAALLITIQVSAQGTNVKLLTKYKDSFLKVIDSNATIYIDNANVMKYLKVAGKENGVDYSKMLKKLKGVCFSAVNLNKPIADKEITMLQELLRSEILVRALVAGKAVIIPNGATQALDKVNYNANLLGNVNELRKFDGIFKDATGKILFTGTKTIK
jgi:hypothetical protein